MNTLDWHARPSLPAPPRRRATAPVTGSRLTARIRLLERRLQEALPQELTDDDRAALDELLETVRALAPPKPSGPADPTRRRRRRSPGDSLAA